MCCVVPCAGRGVCSRVTAHRCAVSSLSNYIYYTYRRPFDFESSRFRGLASTRHECSSSVHSGSLFASLYNTRINACTRWDESTLVVAACARLHTKKNATHYEYDDYLCEIKKRRACRCGIVAIHTIVIRRDTAVSTCAHACLQYAAMVPRPICPRGPGRGPAPGGPCAERAL